MKKVSCFGSAIMWYCGGPNELASHRKKCLLQDINSSRHTVFFQPNYQNDGKVLIIHADSEFTYCPPQKLPSKHSDILIDSERSLSVPIIGGTFGSRTETLQNTLNSTWLTTTDWTHEKMLGRRSERNFSTQSESVERVSA